eukprot:TRINITY_DN18080_c0_g1_i1.p1 TRINITY_DN18080_c0_g1~~TRINITY_DN18080_c0_g1_i1.p1  ORF type:complete len:281 (-),score=30.67 TRINITY_DN18080_c0_g1_i1:192-1034(-)
MRMNEELQQNLQSCKRWDVFPFSEVHRFRDEILYVATSKCVRRNKGEPAGRRNMVTCYIVLGNFNGLIGLGIGKSKKGLAFAAPKSLRHARNNLLSIRKNAATFHKGNTISHRVSGTVGATTCRIMPCSLGHGLQGNRISKRILSYAGVKDANIKLDGSRKTVPNIIRATFAALAKLLPREPPPLWNIHVSLHDNPLLTKGTSGSPFQVEPASRTIQTEHEEEIKKIRKKEYALIFQTAAPSQEWSTPKRRRNEPQKFSKARIPISAQEDYNPFGVLSEI